MNVTAFLFVHSSVQGHVDCFHVLVTVDNTAVNICVQVFMWAYVFTSPGTKLGVELLGHMFNLLRRLPDCFPK